MKNIKDSFRTLFTNSEMFNLVLLIQNFVHHWKNIGASLISALDRRHNKNNKYMHTH